MIFPGNSDPQVWPYPRWIAHRGAGKLAPENTLAAFRLGAEYGYRMFECDAKLSADGVVFLLHDATLERTTNGQGVAGDQPWASLSGLDAGRWHSPRYQGEPLPSIDSLAQFCREGGHALNIEIKPTPGTEWATGVAVAQRAEQLWQGAHVPPLLTSFQTASLAAAQSVAPSLPRGLLLDTLWAGWLDQALALDCSVVVAHFSLWNLTTVGEVHQAGLGCLSYTVNDEATAQHLLDLGIGGLITDRVDFFRPD